MHWRIGIVWAFLAVALAQFNPGPQDYYSQCRTLYEQHVLAGASAACELSLVADPNYVPGLKLLTQIYLDEGRVDDAGDLLERLLELAPNDLETRTLKARYLLEKGRYREALNASRNVPGATASLVRGRALEALGRFNEALAAYHEAAMLGNEQARIEAALLLERMHRPDEALKEIEDVEDPAVGPIKGRLLLSAGRLPEAAVILEETLRELPSTSELYNQTLSALALTYYGMGDFRKGGLVLAQLNDNADLVGGFFNAVWAWLLGVVVLVGLHLFGESRIEPISTLEVREDYTWGVGRLYVAMFFSLLGGALLTVAAGWLRYNNLLAAFTPVQADVVRPVFYLTSAFFMGVTAYAVLRRPPEDAPPPLGKRENWIEGLWVGLLLALLIIGYAWARVRLPWLNAMPFNPLLTSGGVAIASLALAEPLLRVVAPTAFRVRYGTGLAPLFTVLIGGLVWLSPVFMWWAAAALLYAVKQRFAGVWPNIAGWVVAALVLLLAGFFPSLRALF
ncbi:tetratricopeptide repeat protein [Oceanithermus sp.]